MSRDSQTDSRHYSEVSYTMDFGPTTLSEEVEHNGVLRVNEPVGGGQAEYVNPFGSMRNAGDAVVVKEKNKNQRW